MTAEQARVAELERENAQLRAQLRDSMKPSDTDCERPCLRCPGCRRMMETMGGPWCEGAAHA